jgi:hypothetical protein
MPDGELQTIQQYTGVVRIYEGIQADGTIVHRRRFLLRFRYRTANASDLALGFCRFNQRDHRRSLGQP